MSLTAFYRFCYHALILAGRPIGGIRPRRLYDILGRRAYPIAQCHWHKNRWGDELLLFHHFHLDRNILIFGDYDHLLHQLIETRVQPNMTVLDVGANLGEISLHLARRVGPNGKVYAFEPFPAAFERLQTHLAKNHAANVLPFPLALSDHQGTAPMAVPAPSADNQGLGSIINLNPTPAASQLSVPLTTLDAFAEQEHLPKIDFIKLDIQGAEFAFLTGAAKTLAAHRPQIITEVSPTDLAAIGKTSRDLLALLESLHYTCHELLSPTRLKKISAAAIPPDYAATNILCLPG